MEAKKWEDTVMTSGELADICNSVDHFEQGLLAVKVSNAQAEISFKAGIREVVEFVDNNFWKRAVSYEEWQAVKQRWGIDEK